MKHKFDKAIASSSVDQSVDEKLEAFTQTDAFTVCKVLTPSSKDNTSLAVCSLNKTLALDQPIRKKRQNSKTQNSILKIMEKHRESERQRHHSLNRQLRLICESVPGFAVEGKETKVVMMQRIISYIAYLENTVKLICSRLNTNCDSIWFLTNRISQMKWIDPMKKDLTSIASEDSRDSGVSSLSMSRLLKLSSPTINSITDFDSRDSYLTKDLKKDGELTEDQRAARSLEENYIDLKRPDVDWFMNEDEAVIELDQHNASFDPLVDVSADDHAVFEVPTSSFEFGLMDTGEVKWLGSPDKYSFYPPPKTGKGDHVSFGIKFDPQLLDESGHDFCQADVVSPDQVLPNFLIKQEVIEANDFQQSVADGDRNPSHIEDDSDNQVVPQSFSRRKQSTPKKNSHLDLSWNELPVEFTDYVGATNGSPNLMSDNRMVGSFLEVESSNTLDNKGQEYEFDLLQELARVREKVLFAARHEVRTKQDLRRSSWLNGFMMYSCIHRKRFIRDNPGMHTSSISKLVGHAWREMSEDQQTPYREQARICSQELQTILDQKLLNV